MATPSSILTTGTVSANVELCREHHCLTIAVSGMPAVSPGQFAHIIPPGVPDTPVSHMWPGDAWPDLGGFGADAELTYRRAFSIARCRSRGPETEIDLIYRVVGRCTTWMAALRPGDAVSVLGPVGRAFYIPDGTRRALMVAGGVGLPAVLMLAEALARRQSNPVLFCGAQTHDLVPLAIDEPARLCAAATTPLTRGHELAAAGVGLIVSTDDGTLGYAGYVPAALAAYLAAHDVDPQSTVVYTCGPEIMMRRVAECCDERGLACQVCMERPMACALGTCQSCVVPIHDDAAPDGWRYSLCCSEGPVYDARKILWDAPA